MSVVVCSLLTVSSCFLVVVSSFVVASSLVVVSFCFSVVVSTLLVVSSFVVVSLCFSVGVSVGAHKNGKVIDVANALDGDGPFSPERAGGLPSGALMKLCFSGKYTQAEVGKMINGNGGFNAYVGTNDMRDLVKMAETDENAKLVMDAFHYQLAKEIGAMAVVLGGKVDQIILTGGIAYNAITQEYFKDTVSFLAPITIYPGEDELLALAQGAIRVMSGEEEAMKY